MKFLRWNEEFVVIILIIFTVLIAFSFVIMHAFAWNNGCYQGCYPTPTINPCGFALKISDTCTTPSPTEEVTPTQEVTPTPTQEPCRENCGNPPTDSSVHAPPAVTCTIPFPPPDLNSFTAGSSGLLIFGWRESEKVDKYSIIYGYSPDMLVYGEDNIPSTSTSIALSGLQSGNTVWAQVWAWKQGCAEKSNVFDPVAP